MKTFDVGLHRCPSCGARLECVTSVENDNPPVSGRTLGLCVQCGNLHLYVKRDPPNPVYTSEWELRKVTLDELKGDLSPTQVETIANARKLFKHLRKEYH